MKAAWFPRGPYFREKCLFWNMGVPALEKSLLLNIFYRSPGKVLIFNRCVKTWMINIVLRKLRFFQVLWQWRRTFRESQRPVNQSPVARGMTPSGSRHNTTCFIHKILLRSNWEPIGRHMMSRGSCTQFDWSTVSPVHMAHALQNIEHIRGNTATYLRLNSTKNGQCVRKLHSKTKWQNKQTKTHRRCKKIQSGIPLYHDLSQCRRPERGPVISQPRTSTKNLCLDTFKA